MQLRLESAAPLGESLIAQGTISPTQLAQALDEQTRSGRSGGKLGALLAERGWATEEDVTRARSVQFDVPFVSVADENPDPLLVAQVPEEVARRHHLLPLSVRGGAAGSVRVALNNPWNIEGIDLVQTLTRRRVEPLLAGEAALQDAIDRAYRTVGADRLSETLRGAASNPLTAAEDVRNRTAEDSDASGGEGGEDGAGADQAPVIHLLNSVLNRRHPAPRPRHSC